MRQGCLSKIVATVSSLWSYGNAPGPYYTPGVSFRPNTHMSRLFKLFRFIRYQTTHQKDFECVQAQGLSYRLLDCRE